jgi:hypothetical protein
MHIHTYTHTHLHTSHVHVDTYTQTVTYTYTRVTHSTRMNWHPNQAFARSGFTLRHHFSPLGYIFISPATSEAPNTKPWVTKSLQMEAHGPPKTFKMGTQHAQASQHPRFHSSDPRGRRQRRRQPVNHIFAIETYQAQSICKSVNETY